MAAKEALSFGMGMPGAGATRAPRPGLWNSERAVNGGLLVFLLVVCVVPIARLVFELAAALFGPNSQEVINSATSSAAWTATKNSLQVGLLGCVLATVYGTLMATVVTLGNIRYRQFIVFAFVAQAMLAPQVLALAWLQVWIPVKDFLVVAGVPDAATWNNPLQGSGGISFLLGVHYAPLVFLTVRAALLNLPGEVVEAARVFGAPPLRTLVRIVWPLVMPALAAGAALAFVSCVGNFGIPAMLGIPGNFLVLPTLIYRELSGYGPSVIPNVVALSGIVAMLAGAGVLVQKLFDRGEHYRLAAVRSPPARFELGRYRRPAEWTCCMLVTLLMVAPLLALLTKSLTAAPGIPLTFTSATLAQYDYVLFESESTIRAFANSTGLAVGTALVLSVFALAFAYFTQYRRARLLSRLEPLIEVPYVIPGVVLAMAMILLYLRPLPLAGISLYNTLAILFLAYLARFLTIQLRPVISGFRQFPREMLEAAEVFGAGFFTRIQKIILPMLLPSLTAGAILVVLLAMNELTVSALLWATGTETLGVAVFGLEQGGESAAASALGFLTILATFFLMLLASSVGRRLPVGVIPWRA